MSIVEKVVRILFHRAAGKRLESLLGVAGA
jgi:hypothetical protein